MTIGVNSPPNTVAIGVALPSGSNNIGTVTTAGTISVTASQITIGNVGGITNTHSVTLYNNGGNTIYNNGMVIGSPSAPGGNGVFLAPGLIRAGHTSCVVQSAVLFTADQQQYGAFDLLVFNTVPITSTISDYQSLNITQSDFNTGVQAIHLSDARSLGTGMMFQAQQQGTPICAPSGTIAACLVQNGTFASSSTQDLVLNITALSD